MKKCLPPILIFVLLFNESQAQPCTPVGDQSTYGTGNTWIGYVYDNSNLTNYRGYVTAGTGASADFDENFGGSNVSFATNGCPAQSETFSVRYKLNKNFPNGSYNITVGADDGYRFSVDGGVTWLINNWTDHSYTSTLTTTALNGSTNMILEFYENGGDNRVSFAVTPVCAGTENQADFGSGNIWRGYVYDNLNFAGYKGVVTAGTSANPNFDENFGGTNLNYNTSSCPVQTETFSIRYRLNKTFPNGSYQFTVGGDDGYRLSINGGSSYIIDRWIDQGYASTTTTLNLNGNYNLVLEYYENGGSNRVSFSVQALTALVTKLQWITASDKKSEVELNWMVTPSSTPAIFNIERSTDGIRFASIGTLQGNPTASELKYRFTDLSPLEGNAYYRLKMSDKDGSVDYSKSVVVKREETAVDLISVFPTLLTGNSFFIKGNQPLKQATVTVADLSGRILLKKTGMSLTAGNIGEIDAGQLKRIPGIYIVSVLREGMKPVVSKLVIQ